MILELFYQSVHELVLKNSIINQISV